MEILEPGRKNIVVLGAGFGGVTATIKLYRGLKRRGLLRTWNLILVNRTSQHLYTPALYEITSIPKGEADAVCLKSTICVQIPDILGRFPGTRFIGETVEALDPASRTITFASGDVLSFEYVVIALGTETNFFAIPGLQEHSLPIKTFEDAVRLRNRVEELIRSSIGSVEIIVGGGGATGVEVSAEFTKHFAYMKKRMARGKREEHITILEAGPEILAGFSREIVTRARRRLKRLGVAVQTNAAITEVTPDTVVLKDGTRLPYHLLVWSGGVKPVTALKNFRLPLDAKGGVVVNEYLEAAARTYAIGDSASFLNPKTGKPLPWNVPIAEVEARIAARNIVAEITGKPKRAFRPLAAYPFILAVGGKYAVTDLVIIKFFGFLGWLAKQLVELRYLIFILSWPKAISMWLRAVYYSTTND